MPLDERIQPVQVAKAMVGNALVHLIIISVVMSWDLQQNSKTLLYRTLVDVQSNNTKNCDRLKDNCELYQPSEIRSISL